MAILKGEKVVVPVVASESEYGLYVGPKGAYQKAGLQGKAGRWAHLFTRDESKTPNLMNVVEYLKQNHDDFVTVCNGVDDFIRAYTAFKEEYFKDGKAA